MAEAEDVITDAARHATAFVQDLWRRHRPALERRYVGLGDVAPRLDLLAQAVFRRALHLRPAQPPAPCTLLDRLMRRTEAPPATRALPATNGDSIWLPPHFGIDEPDELAVERYRVLLLQQGMRVLRGSARHYPWREDAAVQALYHIFEARAADAALVRELPGILAALRRLHRYAGATRPAFASLPTPLRAIEQIVREVLDATPDGRAPADASSVLVQARRHAGTLAPLRGRVLVKDLWTGEFLPIPEERRSGVLADADEPREERRPARSSRLARRPRVREPAPGEDDPSPAGPMMVQTAQPHEKAEDAAGMQRPTDRDTDCAAEDFAEALAELPEARLVSAPGSVREVLLSDDPPEPGARTAPAARAGGQGKVHVYPEWNWRTGAYADPGATVSVQDAVPGAQTAVDAIFDKHVLMLQTVRRQFELLRAQRMRLRQQSDGEDVDLQGWIDNQALRRAGGWLDQRLYEAQHRGRRSMAVCLLVDISGSTDSWVAAGSRVIDVEREALLMVCVALSGLGEPFCVLGFSGEGPGGVVIRKLKGFEEAYGNTVARRIAGIEPEHYTRAGAALRHASCELMAQAAEHRLLILLSDGKPNDVDEYEGRYGVEDLRQAVIEARLQGISPFCLTIDRQAANYLPAVFGEHAYALLQRAELLPTVLLAWLRKLVAS